MVIQIIKWNIRPEEADAYPEGVKSATGRLLAVPEPIRPGQ